MQNESNINPRIITLVYIAIWGLWIIVFWWSVRAALPYNPIRLPFGERIVQQLIPQGWKFFTRNPREEDLTVVARNGDNEWVDVVRGPNGSVQNVFGLKRDSRAQGIELGLLTSAVPKDRWGECKQQPSSCLNVETTPSIVAENTMPNPTLCGDLGFVLQEPIPWAWSRARKPVIMPSKVLKMNVLCFHP
ncbi:MAG: SdpA family antimicrobial peptide system protein [Pyrinomonadaceae bacterium]